MDEHGRTPPGPLRPSGPFAPVALLEILGRFFGCQSWGHAEEFGRAL